MYYAAIFTIAAALAVQAAPAAFAAPPATRIVVSASPAPDTGSETLPRSTGRARALNIVSGGDLPGNGGEAIVQSANSLPVGFTDGTAPQIQAGIAARYFQAQAARQNRALLANR